MRPSRAAHEGERLQRLFSAFPAGRAGSGLLLLRLAAGAAAISEGFSFFADSEGLAAPGVLTGAVAILAGAALVVGVLAPLAGMLVAVVGVSLSASLLPLPSRHPLDGPPALALLTAIAIAIVFLGPGALSIDSYLFGRREIVIPPDFRPTDRE